MSKLFKDVIKGDTVFILDRHYNNTIHLRVLTVLSRLGDILHFDDSTRTNISDFNYTKAFDFDSVLRCFHTTDINILKRTLSKSELDITSALNTLYKYENSRTIK